MKNQRLQNIVSIANIVSSLAVLISIIFLINEYKRSGVFNEKTIENLVYSRIMELDKLIIENPDMGDIISIAYTKPDSLKSSDKIRYLAFEHIFYDSWETLWVGYKDGVVEEKTWNDWNVWFIQEAKKKPMLSWEGNLDQFSTDFLDLIKNDMNINEN